MNHIVIVIFKFTDDKMNFDSYNDITINVGSDNSNPQLLSYYPKYEYFDNILSKTCKDKINIFVDLKGCATGIYQEWCVRHIINSSKIERHLNLDIFSSVLYFIAFHKRYAANRNLKFKIYFFMEQGKSKYHLNIYDKYKANRANSDFFGLDTKSREEFFSILDKNYGLCEYVVNKIPDCSFYCLKYCEADFIPWYLMKHKIPQENLKQSINVVYSRDKDMLQCLEFDNSYQFYKGNNKVEFITEKTLFNHHVKIDDNNEIKNAAKWFPLFLALCGDTADGVPGVFRLGPKNVYKNFDVILKAFNNDPELMYKRIMNGDNIITESWEYSSTETLKKIFGNPDIAKRNMKLVSYKALSDYVNGGYPTEAIEIKKYIDKIWDNNVKLSSYKILWDNLNKKGLSDIIDQRVIEECFL